jgi:hypothetical protein
MMNFGEQFIASDESSFYQANLNPSQIGGSLEGSALFPGNDPDIQGLLSGDASSVERRLPQ